MAEGKNFGKLAWYQTEVQSINSEAQRLLENYSGLRPDEVLPHVLKLRDEAFSVWHYPCIGQLRFLSFSLPEHTVYSRVLTRLREDPTAGFLEAGCCFGQEIRYLADQGIPGVQLMGCDVDPAFFDLGYKLFRDEKTLGATFVSADLTSEQCLEPSTEISRRLASKIDIVYASSLFHLWDYERQVRAAMNLVLLCREKPGVMLVGRQLGSVLAGRYSMKDVGKGVSYRHNIESLKGLWYDVGQATNTCWTVEAGLYIGSELPKVRDSAWADANDRMIWWCVTRQHHP